MPQLFISYAREDVDFVRQLTQNLEKRGFSIWWDDLVLRGGDNWPQTIQAALMASDYCLVVLSPAAIKSGWVEKEYLYTLGLGLRLIPILYKPCKIPMALVNVHRIDFWENTYDQGFRKLLKAFDTDSTSTTNAISNRNFIEKFKEYLLKALRDPIWQMIGAFISFMTLAWTIYIAISRF